MSATGRAALDRTPVAVLLGLFAVCVVGGLVELLIDQDTTRSTAGVAAANGVHVALGVALAVAVVVARRRNRRAAAAFWISPFTGLGWRRLVDGTVSIPCAVAELALAVTGQGARVAGRGQSMAAVRSRP